MALPSLPYLRGMYFVGKDFIGGDQWPVEDAAEYYLSAKKMNSVRLGIDWRAIQPTLGADLDASFMTGVDALVQQVTSRGGYIILDLHAYGRRYKDGTDIIGQSGGTLTAAHLADFWSRVADRYKGNSKVIFELMNEPHDLDGLIWAATQFTCHQAIRATGAQNKVIFTPNMWNIFGFGTAQKACLNTLAGLLGFKPTVAMHYYFDQYSAGISPDVVANYMDPVTAATTWLRANAFPAICTEYGSSNDTASLAALAALLSHFEINSDVWGGYLNLGGGGWWTDPMFRIDPRVGQFSWSGTLYDVPQMQVLQQYLLGASAYNGPPSNGVTLSYEALTLGSDFLVLGAAA